MSDHIQPTPEEMIEEVNAKLDAILRQLAELKKSYER